MLRAHKRSLFILLALLGLCLGTCRAQDTTSLSGRWIPTDLNKAVISRLQNSTLGTLQSQIAGYSTLGIISSDVVKTWLTTLVNNPNARDGTVRWQPQVASKCSSGIVGCTKSIMVTMLEFTYNNPNGTDCQARAQFAAAAILPPYATLSDSSVTNSSFMPQGYPIVYELVAAPNATASSCTYIIQYPQATQNLANQICISQFGNSSCTDSPCVPCNANQTLVGTTGDPENNCKPGNGVAPALVAAIEGAAQCLSVGGVGRFGCQVGYPVNNSACSAMHCFPGDSLVLLEAGKEIQMQDLRVGDRVQVARSDGSLDFEDVYFFGHKDRMAVADFVRLDLIARESGQLTRRSIEASSQHFVYVLDSSSAKKDYSARRAKDVRIGNILQISDQGQLVEAQVVAVGSVTKQGLWNPYTMSGRIVVNGVAVSSHSEWALDPLFDMMGLTSWLPTIYQVLLTPLRVLYMLIGPEAMLNIGDSLQIDVLLNALGTTAQSLSLRSS